MKLVIGASGVLGSYVTRQLVERGERVRVLLRRTSSTAAVDADLRRFVFTSSIGTIALSEDGRPVAEDEPFNWADNGGDYIRSRVEAENLVLQRELGWTPLPIHDSIRRAAAFYLGR